MGHQDGGQLTKALSKKPNSVVLLDEVEKAHPDVLNILLQVFDEGRLTDGQGQTVDCSDSIFIMTSNLCQNEIAAEMGFHKYLDGDGNVDLQHEPKQISRQFINGTIIPTLRQHFKRDEFLGRVNETILFLPFNQDQLNEIASRQLIKLREKAERNGMELTWDPEIVNLLSREYNPHYGARSIEHYVSRTIVNLIASAHEMGQISHGSAVHIKYDSLTQDFALSASKRAFKSAAVSHESETMPIW